MDYFIVEILMQRESERRWRERGRLILQNAYLFKHLNYSETTW